MTESIVKLTDNTWYMRGSPSTLIYMEDDVLYVIDPGRGKNRGKELNSFLKKLGGNLTVIVLTHYHNDHLEIANKIDADRIWASSIDAPLVKNPMLRIIVTLGYPLPKDHPLLTLIAVPVRVDTEFQPGERVGPLQTIHAPGHTPGQVVIMTSNNTLYLADSVFGDQVLRRYGIPYHVDLPTALETMYRIRDELLRDAELVVFSHGPLMSRREAAELVELNIRHHEKIIKMVFEEAREGASYQAITISILRKLGVTPDLPQVIRASSAVKSVIAKHLGEKIEAIVTDKEVLFKIKE